MEIEVLLSAMHQKDLSLIKQCNIDTSCLVINQCDKEDYIEERRDNNVIRMISTIERGLSRSRNKALDNSIGDICVICDDDVCYREGYSKIIKKAFSEVPKADIIVFNINSLNPELRPQEKMFTKISRIPKHKLYSSVHIAFRRNSIISKNIRFDERFGSGSNMFSMAEDSLFFSQIHKQGLKAYTYPAVIADLSSETSTWFKGYNKKYFYDVGAFLSAGYPSTKNLLKFYYPFRFKNLTDLSTKDILLYIKQGMHGYKNGSPYSEDD